MTLIVIPMRKRHILNSAKNFYLKGVRKFTMEETKYYRYDIGNVIVRRTGDLIEKMGKNNTWEPAPHLIYRFMSGNMSLTEISQEDAEEMIKQHKRENE